MVVHEAVGPNAPIKALAHTLQPRQEGFTITIASEDALPRVTARHHMVEGSRELDAQRAGHAMSLDQ